MLTNAKYNGEQAPFFVYVWHATKGGLDHFQLSVLSTLQLSSSYPSEKDMVIIGGTLDLNLTEMKRFLQSQKSKKLRRKETPLKCSNLAGY